MQQDVHEHRTHQRWWRPVLLAVAVCLAVAELRGHLPDATSTWGALRQARVGWLLAAAVLQVVSMAAFAEQQRHLLAGFGVRMPAPVSLAVTYARSAMATALPGGSAVSAGYAFRQFRTRGADQSVAAATMVLSGVASVAGLALLYAGATVIWTTPSPRVLAVVAGAVSVLVLALKGVRGGRLLRTPTAVDGHSRWQRLLSTVQRTGALALTVRPSRWLAVLALAVLNWLTDLACLVTAVHAAGLTVPVHTVATAYLGAQLLRQIPVTPGGIGVIEAALIVALTAAGAAAAPAAAAVLVYRLLSCWSVLPIGLACWTAQKPGAAPQPEPTQLTDPAAPVAVTAAA